MAQIYATDSNINITKAQRNFTQDPAQPFTTDFIAAKEGDIVQFQFTITNPSTVNSVYNITVNDILSHHFSYIGPVNSYNFV